MSHLYIIVPIVLLIVYFQFQFFNKGRFLINSFKKLFPNDAKFEKIIIYVPKQTIESDDPIEIINNISSYKDNFLEDSIEIVLINQLNGQPSDLSTEIISNINIYLLRNKGAVSDFNMIRDIVNRYSDSLEEEIQTILPVPLYLGLIGTMAGIIGGLLVFGTDKMTEFMWGVAVAMVASILGLIFTTWNSGWLLKSAKNNAETNKNRFFTFVQTELLPIFNKDATSSIYALQGYLSAFNEKFESNIFNFTGLLDKILISFDNQVEVIRELKQLDIKSIQQFNVTVLKELKNSIGELERFSKSAKEFEQFGEYITQLNRFIDITFQLNNSIDSQLKRTGQIEIVIDNINNNIIHSSRVLGYLESHYKTIEDRDNVIRQAVASVDATLEDSFELLEKHSREKVEAIHKMTIADSEALKVFNESSMQNIEELSKKVSIALHNIGESVVDKIKAISSIYINEKEGINEMFRDEFAKLADIKDGFTMLCDTVVKINQTQCDELRKLTIQQQEKNDILIERLISNHKEDSNKIEAIIQNHNHALSRPNEASQSVLSEEISKPGNISIKEYKIDKLLNRIFYIVGIIAFVLLILSFFIPNKRVFSSNPGKEIEAAKIIPIEQSNTRDSIINNEDEKRKE